MKIESDRVLRIIDDYLFDYEAFGVISDSEERMLLTIKGKIVDMTRERYECSVCGRMRTGDPTHNHTYPDFDKYNDYGLITCFGVIGIDEVSDEQE